jgi:hypothetical protein
VDSRDEKILGRNRLSLGRNCILVGIKIGGRRKEWMKECIGVISTEVKEMPYSLEWM